MKKFPVIKQCIDASFEIYVSRLNDIYLLSCLYPGSMNETCHLCHSHLVLFSQLHMSTINDLLVHFDTRYCDVIVFRIHFFRDKYSVSAIIISFLRNFCLGHTIVVFPFPRLLSNVGQHNPTFHRNDTFTQKPIICDLYGAIRRPYLPIYRHIV